MNYKGGVFFVFLYCYCLCGVVVGMQQEKGGQDDVFKQGVDILNVGEQWDHEEQLSNLQKISSIANKFKNLCKIAAQKGKETTKYYVASLLNRLFSHPEEVAEFKNDMNIALEIAENFESLNNKKELEKFSKALIVQNTCCKKIENSCQVPLMVKSITYRGYSTLVMFLVFYIFYDDYEKALTIAFIDLLAKTFLTYWVWDVFWQCLKNKTGQSNSSLCQKIHKFLTHGETYANTTQFQEFGKNLDKLQNTLDQEIQQIQCLQPCIEQE